MRRLRPAIIVLTSAALFAAPGMSALAQQGAMPTPEQILVDHAGVPFGAVMTINDVPGQHGFRAGDALTASGTIGQLAGLDIQGVPVTFNLSLIAPSGATVSAFGPFSAGSDGTFSQTLPALATTGLDAGTYAVALTDVVHAGQSQGEVARAAATVVDPTTTLIVHNSFASSTGWVKPGDSYTFRVFVENHTALPGQNVEVTLPSAPSVSWTDAVSLGDVGTIARNADTITWTIPSVAAAGESGPAIHTLVGTGQVDSTGQDPRVVWKDLSATATMTYTGYVGDALTSESHGPKVIPPSGDFETSRFGDKPFPIIPVNWVDRLPQAKNDPALLDEIINSPDFEGSMINLYQEMSFGQLYPIGSIPSAGIASASYSEVEEDMRWTSGVASNSGTCRGGTLADLPGAIGPPAFDQRIRNGWYQLPGTTEYYGGDYPVFDLGTASSIDSACGQLGKGVYDAASAADPDIDYNDFDSDRDGVVDFFMLVFVGCGGNGGSQVPIVLCEYPAEPYDNIWPHSSSLEAQYTDAETGLRGYISFDQLRSVTEVPQCYTSALRIGFDDCAANGGTGDDAIPVPVRVGPYNVNPETVFEAASVISHEYGHHLGLPDFYNSGSDYDTYRTFNLMASDYSQNFTVFSKQDMGWVVPTFLQPGEELTVTDMTEIRVDTGEISWVQPDGTPYTLSAANGDQNVHNADSVAVKLPKRILIGEDALSEGASGDWVWWSTAGSDFGCSPTGASNLDLHLPELADIAPGADIELRFSSSWDIEWDFDYAFTLATTNGHSYTSLPSQNGYTTSSSFNPNSNQCHAETDNALTGQSGSWDAGTQELDRSALGGYDNATPFLKDSYDLSDYAGETTTVRFSYSTDPAFERPAWFIDDVELIVDGEVIWSDDIESDPDEFRWYPGGCGKPGTAAICTRGWKRVAAGLPNEADHGYYVELRDRAGFDLDGYGQSDRGTITWEPGLLIEYTDEAHGYGNNGTAVHPAQHYLDSSPVAGAQCDTAACDNSAFTDEAGRNTFSDAAATPWLENFDDPEGIDGRWTFDYDCLDLEVLSMSGEDTIERAVDLTATVKFTANAGCAEFDAAGQAEPVGADPVARMSIRPAAATVGQTITFDGSTSADDQTLTYAWDFGDSTATATGETVQHSYAAVGDYTVTLQVADPDGNTSVATQVVTVSAAPVGGGAPLPSTGGGLAAGGLMLLVAASGVRRRRS